MGIGLSSLVIQWHTFDLPVNLYGNKNNKKITKRKFQNDTYYELIEDQYNNKDNNTLT